jgi:hypothetical protein
MRRIWRVVCSSLAFPELPLADARRVRRSDRDGRESFGAAAGEDVGIVMEDQEVISDL